MAQLPTDQTLAQQLRILIRYLASGFVALIVLNFLGFNSELVPHNGTSVWYTVIIASLFGLIIYAVHASAGDDFFYRTSLRIIIRNTNRANYLPDQFKEYPNDIETKYNWLKKLTAPIKEKQNKLFSLYEYRVHREGTNNPKLMGIMKRLDQNLTFMTFLYVSSYPLIFFPIGYSLVLLLKKFFRSNEINIIWSWSNAIMVLIGLALMIFGIILDVRTTKWEMWFIKKYQVNSNCDDILYSEKNNYFIELTIKD